MNLAIDIGNTRVKVAVFEDNTIRKLVVFEKTKIITEIKKIIKFYPINLAVVSSVAAISSYKMAKLSEIITVYEVSAQVKKPFQNLYKTPNTLGIDRIVLVFAAAVKYPKRNVLIIDAGTCITFDILTQDSQYLGGAISPGLEMRYKSLHDYTSKLPLLSKEKPINFIGNTTNNSIHSGVVNGVVNEINGVIEQYEKKYLDLTVVLTGGDTNFLSKQLKSSIFANQNFLLEGLNEILIYNDNK